jgi:bifunctional non-homologous end joining protein LigD
MQTEDHPVEYGDFEGIIPEGEYGGGTVVLWDRGTWEPVENPHEGLRKGSLKFRLDGEKLQGRWTLVKIKGRDARDDKSWLLIKEKDDHVRPSSEYDVTEARPESVLTGRTLEEIARDRDRVWHSNREDPLKGASQGRPGGPAARPRHDFAARAAAVPRAKKAALPRTVQPELATLVDEAPAGDEWLHEMKFDGYRILARLDAGKVSLVSRNGKDWTSHFPSVADTVGRLPARRALLDGEVAVVLPSGTTSFQALQNALLSSEQADLVYFVFDLLHLEGYDLTGAPLEERKSLLQELTSAGAARRLRYSDHVAGSGREFFEQASRLGVEGILSKRRDSPYKAGRSKAWLKVKCLKRQEFVIGGWTDPEGARVGIGSLLLGVHEGDDLVFAGKVGTGFSDRLLAELRKKLSALEQKASPFRQARIPGVTRAHWVRPALVGEVAFTEWTHDGRLRHPSFQGLRADKDPKDIVRETPRHTEEVAAGEPPPRARAPKRGAARTAKATRPARNPSRRPGAPIEVSGVRLTNPDRVLYPDLGLTKEALAGFYVGIGDRILPHVEGRPLTLVRCPEGLGKPCFYMKHSGVWAPPALRRVKIQEKTKVGDYLVADDLEGVLSLVQMGILEVHTWNSRADDVEQPDRVVFDLDPDEAVAWAAVVEAARLLRSRLEDLDLESYVKTTGGKGLHVVVPLKPDAGWEATLEFTRVISERLEREEPARYTTEMSKARRKGKILIDYLRNSRGSTSVAAYSTRAKPQAPVSTPIRWDELGRVRPDQFTVANLGRRLEGMRSDPWAGYFQSRQRLTAAIRKTLGIA